MKLLSKIGKVALQVTTAILGFGPIIQQTLPGHGGQVVTVLDTISRIRDIIIQAEIMGQALQMPGEQKLTMATPAVAQILLTSDLLTGRKIDDPELFKSGAMRIAAGMADVLNSLEDKIETENHG